MTEAIPGVPRSEIPLREAARRIYRAALDAVDPEALVRGAIENRERGATLFEGEREGGRIRLVAVGKAAVTMARGAVAALGRERVSSGIVLTPEGTGVETGLPDTIRVFEGGHPLPTPGGMKGAQAIHTFMGSGTASGEGPVLFLLSGGGSALLALPREGITLADLRETTSLLLRAGASIEELNAVRKHLELAKGGGLARAAQGTPVLALLVSDVIGDPLDVIASGPLTPDPTTFADALGVLDRFDLRARVPQSVAAYLLAGEKGDRPESPKEGDPCFASTEIEIVGNLSAAARGAAAQAEREGYPTRILTLELTGEARDAGRRMGELGMEVRGGGSGDSAPVCLVSGGETTVTVSGQGQGGRNQEFALGAAPAIAGGEGLLVASMGTDGIDGPTDAAGALATGSTMARAREAGLDAEVSLRENDSYTFFRRLDDLLITGPTGTNVMDLQLLIVE